MAALFFMEIFAYYASGLFLLENVTTSNYSEKLTYIFIHFYHLWWNERTPGIMGLALILWALGVSYFLDIYKAVECTPGEELFHFHDNPNQACPVGRNIHHSVQTCASGTVFP